MSNFLATVVLLHSSASSSRQWERLASMLVPRYRVVAVDFHGHGAGPAFATRNAPASFIDDAAVAISGAAAARVDNDRRSLLALDASLLAPVLASGDRVHLVGHSYGGAVAIKAATMHPESVASVIAYEPVLFRLLSDTGCERQAATIRAVADSMFEQAEGGDFDAAAQRFVDFWAGAPVWRRMAENQRNAIATRMPVVLSHFDALLDEPAFTRAGLASLPVPVRLLVGERTVHAMTVLIDRAVSAMPNASVDVVPQCGHMGPVTDPEAVNRRIVDILDMDVAKDLRRAA